MAEYVVTIDNPGDKLSQVQWSRYVGRANDIIAYYAKTIYFSGSGNAVAPWQNYAWYYNCPGFIKYDLIREELDELRVEFKQDSIAMGKVFPDPIIDISAQF